MASNRYSSLSDDRLFELIFIREDRLEREAALEMAGRDSLAPYLGQLVMEKHSWLCELPEWWAVVHGVYILGLRAGRDEVLPLITALRWSDAYDCDWVTELMPAIFGRLGEPAKDRLTTLALDKAAGWSARDLALKALAAITLNRPETEAYVFRIIGERFMDEDEDPTVRQLAGMILLDFRRENYRMPLLKMAREQWLQQEYEGVGGPAYYASLDPDEVEWAFKNPQPELWHYQEDWMRFYHPEEIQRRQKRWAKERLGSQRAGKLRTPPSGGGSVLPLNRHGKTPELGPLGPDEDGGR